MPNPLPDPSPEMLLSTARRMGNREDVVLLELIRIFNKCLNPYILFMREHLNLAKLPTTNGAYIDGEDEENATHPYICIGTALTMRGVGPASWLGDGQVAIALVCAPGASRRDMHFNSLLSNFIAHIMAYYCKGHSDSENRHLWNKMEPVDRRPIPLDWKEATGFVMVFNWSQNPNSGVWER